MQTRIKICGITRIEDGLAAARLGADAIGLVFYEATPRHVTIDQACAIAQALPPFVTRVGLFVDVDADKVRATISAVGLDILQFHGEESAETYRAFDRPYIKAVRMRDDVDLHAQRRAYPDAIGLLLDTYVKHAPGGSGKTFDWRLVPRDLEKPIILAGGLTADNVKDAIKVVQPFAVDVSSGVEETKGIKDPKKISAFIERVREDQ